MVTSKIAQLLIVLALVLPMCVYADMRMNGGPFIAEMSPGESLTHEVIIECPEEDQALDFEAIVMGFGMDTVGGPQLIPNDKYNETISAINIINVTPSRFRLEPGQSQVVTIEANMPDNIGDGTKYALVNIRGYPKENNGSINIALAINTRVQLTVAGSNLIRTANIARFELNPDGNATMLLTNTGNTDMKASAKAELRDAKGNILGNATCSAAPFGIIPSYSQEFLLSFNPESRLTPGTYNVEATAELEDGTIVASKEMEIEI